MITLNILAVVVSSSFQTSRMCQYKDECLESFGLPGKGSYCVDQFVPIWFAYECLPSYEATEFLEANIKMMFNGKLLDVFVEEVKNNSGKMFT